MAFYPKEAEVLAFRWLALSLTISAVACAGAHGGDEAGVQVPAEAEAVVQMARGDAAGRTNTAPDSLQVRSVEAVQWSDASLGCPELDRIYAQVITPGYRIVLAAEGQEYVYHASASRVIPCPPDRAQTS